MRTYLKAHCAFDSKHQVGNSRVFNVSTHNFLFTLKELGVEEFIL